MEDIAPELLRKIQEQFEQDIEKNSTIKKFKELTKKGKVTYQQASEVTQEIGRILAKAYSDNLSSAVLPDGRMYYNIASRVLEPTLKNAYEMAADNAEVIQKAVNEVANVGIKAKRAQIQQDNIDGIINRISSEENFDDVKWILDAPVRNLVQKSMDDTVKANADFHAKTGLKPKIIRKSSGHCCEWCNQVAGTYSYPDVPKDVFRRHDNCDCILEYYPGDGKKQDVWSKEWKYEKESDKIEARKLRGLNPDEDEVIRNIRMNIIPKQNREQIAPRQEIHRQGTQMYETRKQALANKGQYGPSYITISDEEIKSLVNEFSGTGLIKYNSLGNWDSKEIITTNDKIIGVVVDNRNGNSAETSVFKIHYAKDGIHIVPDYPSKKR